MRYIIKDVEALDASLVTLSPVSFSYTGGAQFPTPTVKNAAGKTLTAGVDYTVTYSAVSVDPGAYELTITGRGQYAGSVCVAYAIE